jgi:hypothetical protein
LSRIFESRNLYKNAFYRNKGVFYLGGYAVNKNLLSSMLFLVIVSGGFTLAGTMHLETVQAATEVIGIINSDTTWTVANSPYNLTGPVLVSNGVTLRIEAGVTVNTNDHDHYIQVDGALYAMGISSKPIYFNEGSIRFTEVSSGWNETTGTGSIIEKAVLNRTSVWVNGDQKVNSNTVVRGPIKVENGTPLITNNDIDGYMFVVGGSPVISHNTILGNPGSDWLGRPVYDEYGISLEASTAHIFDNVILGRFTEAAIEVSSGGPTIERNLIINHYGFGGEGYRQAGIRIYRGDDDILIRSNTITESPRGIDCASSLTTIMYNNIQGNINYNIYLRSSAKSDVNATYNWWGTTDTEAISELIFDFEEDFNLGKVIFTPFLTEPNSEAPEKTAPPPTPTPTASPTPTPSTTPSPTASPTPTPTPEPPQTDFATIAGAAIVITVLAVGLGLLIYLIKRK